MKKNLVIAAGIAALTVTACVSAVKQERNVAGIAEIFRQNAEQYSQNFGDQTPARRFTDADIKRLASSSNLKLRDARVILDNDSALDSKIEMIKRAKKNIRMVYFIYADDESTALMTQELINAGKRGVKVKLLVDFITNYSRLDLFEMMVKESNKNIHVSFYNFPGTQILRDAKFMTLPCPPAVATKADECSQAKAQMMKQLEGTEVTPFSKLFLSGLYGKNAIALKVAMGYGAGIDPAQYKKMKEETDETEQDIIFGFFKLAKDAMSGSLSAKIELSKALTSNGATLNPILNEITGRLPLTHASGSREGAAQAAEWDHLTDYVHHKLLAVDETEFQLGGRNVEDSYHMKSRLGTKGKYIFMDTDFWARTDAGGTREIVASFDKMYDKFSQMVAPIERVQKLMPNDMIRNKEALTMATGSCVQSMQQGKVQFMQLGSCVESSITKMPTYKSQSIRLAEMKAEVDASANLYKSKYTKVYRDNHRNVGYSESVEHLSKSDLDNAQFYYLENVAYAKSGELKRRAGARVGGEEKFNKNIHAAWYRGLENTCRVSRDEKRDVRVVLHTAYLFMPSGLTHKLAKMMNGDYGDCSRVRVTFLTNSFATTDLNVINIFARYQMSAIFKHYAGLVAYEQYFNKENAGIRKYGRFFPTLEYYEYNQLHVGLGNSLHTKVSLLGDDMIIGSANADVRSYYMDTNNGMLIRGAQDLNRDYLAYVDSIINDRNKSVELSGMYARVSDSQIIDQNKEILAAIVKRWDKKGRVNQERQQQILGVIHNLGGRIVNDTNRMLNFRGDFEQLEMSETKDRSALELELNQVANGFDDMFKVL